MTSQDAARCHHQRGTRQELVVMETLSQHPLRPRPHRALGGRSRQRQHRAWGQHEQPGHLAHFQV